ETSMHHEVEAAERFVGFVDALQQVEHLKTEVNHEDVEKILRDFVEAANVDFAAAQASGRHVQQHDGGDSRNHGREDEDDRHQRRGPPGVRLDRSEDKADVSVQKK